MRQCRTAVVTVVAAIISMCSSLAAQDVKPPSTAPQKSCPTIFSAPMNSWTERLSKCALPDTYTVNIDTTPEIPSLRKPTEVYNGSAVHVVITKRPVDDCKLKASSEKYENGSTLNALAQLLGLFSHPGAAQPHELVVASFNPDGIPKTITSKFAVIDSELQQAKVYVDAYGMASDHAKQFIKCVSDAGCKDSENAEELLLELNAVLYPAIPPPDTRNMNRMADDVAALLDASPEDSKWFPAAKKHLEEERQGIQAIELGDEYRRQLRSEFEKLASDLATYKALATMGVTLPSQKNTKFTGTIVCVNHFTHQQFGSDVSFTVLYYNPAPVTASAGVLISPLSKRPIGVLSQSTPCNSTSATMNCYAVTSTSDAQFVPIGMGNIYLSGSPKVNLNLSAGVGVNLNNGGTQVEYFLGPAIGIHGFYISPGIHLARFPYLVGGFQLGDPVPAGGNAASAPVVYRTTAHFAFTISYRLTPAK